MIRNTEESVKRTYLPEATWQPSWRVSEGTIGRTRLKEIVEIRS